MMWVDDAQRLEVQREVVISPARLRVLATNRGFGKTTVAKMAIGRHRYDYGHFAHVYFRGATVRQTLDIQKEYNTRPFQVGSSPRPNDLVIFDEPDLLDRYLLQEGEIKSLYHHGVRVLILGTPPVDADPYFHIRLLRRMYYWASSPNRDSAQAWHVAYRSKNTLEASKILTPVQFRSEMCAEFVITDNGD